MDFRSRAAFLFTMGELAVATGVRGWPMFRAGEVGSVAASHMATVKDFSVFGRKLFHGRVTRGVGATWLPRDTRACSPRAAPATRSARAPALLAMRPRRGAHNVAPAVTQNGLTGHGCVVVPTIIAERLIFRVRLSAVQLHEHPPSRIPNVAVTAAAGGCDLGLIAESGRQTVDMFDLPPITKFERRCDPVGRLGKDLADELSPTVARSRTQRCAESAGGGESALDRLEDEMDCHRTVLPVAHL